jgi:uncharacterized protein (TIGR00295 family)
MLSYEEGLALLHCYGKDAAWIRHCRAVSRVAERLSGAISPDYPFDAEFFRVGALLHDIGRYKTHDPVMHGVEGYHLLMGLGHDREAFVCASHVFCGMARAEAVRYGLPDQDFLPRTLEERLVPLIDSVVELDQPTTLEQRMLSINRRYQGNVLFLERMQQAALIAGGLLHFVNSEFGVSLEQLAAEALQ